MLVGQFLLTGSWTPPHTTSTGQSSWCIWRGDPGPVWPRVWNRFKGVCTCKVRRAGGGMKPKWGHLWQWHLRCLYCAFTCALSMCWPWWQTLLPSKSQTVLKSDISAFWCLMLIISCRAAWSGGQSSLCLVCQQPGSWSTDQLTAAPTHGICLQKSISNNPTQRQREAVC